MEVDLSDGVEVDLSDGVEVDLSDGVEVVLSDGVEVDLSDGVEVDLSDGVPELDYYHCPTGSGLLGPLTIAGEPLSLSGPNHQILVEKPSTNLDKNGPNGPNGQIDCPDRNARKCYSMSTNPDRYQHGAGPHFPFAFH